VTPSPAPLVLFGRPGCHLCEDARATLDVLLRQRATGGLAVPPLVERNIEDDPALHDRYAFTIPVLVFGERELELATTPARLRRFLADVLDGTDAGVGAA
jgi:glutaredoxin